MAGHGYLDGEIVIHGEFGEQFAGCGAVSGYSKPNLNNARLIDGFPVGCILQ